MSSQSYYAGDNSYQPQNQPVYAASQGTYNPQSQDSTGFQRQENQQYQNSAYAYQGQTPPYQQVPAIQGQQNQQYQMGQIPPQQYVGGPPPNLYSPSQQQIGGGTSYGYAEEYEGQGTSSETAEGEGGERGLATHIVGATLGRKAGRKAGFGPVATLAAGFAGAKVLRNIQKNRQEKRSSSRDSRNSHDSRNEQNSSRRDDYGRDDYRRDDYRRDDYRYDDRRY